MTSPTFAEKAKKKITPLTTFSHLSEEQGIIFDHLDGTKIRDYLLAIHTLVGGAQNIIAASRVSGGKVIVFLSSRDIVDKFQLEHGGFTMGATYFQTRKLKAPSIKIILSNVSPIIPNSIIENSLAQLGLKPIAPISILRFNPSDDIFSHVISWRRQFYLPANTDLTKIPPILAVTYEERTYRIFLTKGDFVCFKCNQKGHKAENYIAMPNIDDVVDEYVENVTPPSQLATSASFSDLNFPPLQPTEQPAQSTVNLQIENKQPLPIKRGASEIESYTTSDTHSIAGSILMEDGVLDKEIVVKIKQKRNKKRKPNSENYLKVLTLTPAETNAIANCVNHIRQTKYPDCDFMAEDLIKLLPTIRNCPNKKQLANSFTCKIDCLLFTLEEIKPQMELGTKRTITSFTKALILEETQSESSDASP